MASLDSKNLDFLIRTQKYLSVIISRLSIFFKWCITSNIAAWLLQCTTMLTYDEESFPLRPNHFDSSQRMVSQFINYPVLSTKPTSKGHSFYINNEPFLLYKKGAQTTNIVSLLVSMSTKLSDPFFASMIWRFLNLMSNLQFFRSSINKLTLTSLAYQWYIEVLRLPGIFYINNTRQFCQIETWRCSHRSLMLSFSFNFRFLHIIYLCYCGKTRCYHLLPGFIICMYSLSKNNKNILFILVNNFFMTLFFLTKIFLKFFPKNRVQLITVSYRCTPPFVTS